MFQLLYTKAAEKDAKNLKAVNLEEKVKKILEILKKDPFQNPPPFKKLQGEMKGSFSRRINLQHRLVYIVFPERKVVRVLRMWTHYGE